MVFLVVFLVFYLSRETRISSSRAIVSETGAVLFLEERTGIDELIGHLSDLEVQFNETELRWVASLLGWRNFSPGRYEIPESSAYQDLLSRIALGIQDLAAVTIPPGIDKGRLARVLGNQLESDSSQFASVFTDSSDLVLELGHSPQTLLSRMLPDTYNIYWTSPPERVIRRIYNEFNRRVTDRRQEEIDANELDLEDLVTLASIIEWEASAGSEKRRISGLYWNRLRRNMRLQADPTVIYALGEHRRLLYDDYRFDHPYNTYIIRGLPPGPITNPDLASIEAAIDPEEHDYLYMVARPGGGHAFSSTFEEHQLASAEWRRWIREQFRIRDERERLQEIEEQETY